jgi:hypothetical protein
VDGLETPAVVVAEWRGWIRRRESMAEASLWARRSLFFLAMAGRRPAGVYGSSCAKDEQSSVMVGNRESVKE